MTVHPSPTAAANATPTRVHGACASPLRVAVPVMLRLMLGGLLIFSGLMKLDSIRLFVATIKEFHLGVPDDLRPLLAYTIIDSELILGAALVLGFLTRGAAALVVVMMLGFAAGLLHVMASGAKVDCSCFGSIRFICTDAVGTCHIVRNSVLALAAATLVVMGPGGLALDRLFGKRSPMGSGASAAEMPERSH